jgi:hypothetical protein
VATCPGSLIVHADGTVAGCTEDDEPNGSAAARHGMRATRSGVGLVARRMRRMRSAVSVTLASTRKVILRNLVSDDQGKRH